MNNKKDNSPENNQDKPVIKNDTAPHAVFISQKCNRLASALYAVTRFLADDEPLKNRLRSLALSLAESSHTPNPTSDVSGTFDILTRLRDQLTIARDGGLLSQMNHQVFIEEIDALRQKLREEGPGFGPHVNSEYFDLEGVDESLSQPSTTRNKKRSDSSKKTAANQKTGEKQQQEDSTPPSSPKQRRRQKILDLFADTDEITVNDVTEVINGYSTKTIQRDLKALVKAGKLEKHGKRRWTSYTRA